MRLCHRNLHKEEREERKDCRLHKPYKDLKGHHRNRENHVDKMLDDQNNDFPRKDISKETERKGYYSCHLGKYLYNPHEKAHCRAKVNKFLPVPQRTERHNTKYLYRKDRDECERKRHIEVGIHRT